MEITPLGTVKANVDAAMSGNASILRVAEFKMKCNLS